MTALRGNALTTVAAVRSALGITAGDALVEDRLTMLINQASATIEAELGRRLGMADYSESIMPSGTQYQMLRQWPVINIASVTQFGETIDPVRYSASPDGLPILYKDDGWQVTGYPVGLAYDVVRINRNLLVTYTAGYVLPKDAAEDNPATLPADLEGLCVEMVLSAYGKMTSGGMAGLKSFGISDVRWEWINEMPPDWRRTLDRHRRWV